MQAELGVPVPETHLEQGIEVDLPETPAEIAEREGIHERIQVELRNGDIEDLSHAEEMLELPQFGITTRSADG